MKSRNRSVDIRSGFTLIEMLVVVLIILLLSGMLFKIAGLVGEKAARSRAVADIANLEYALAEFYSVYDIYPPTSQNAYVYENKDGQESSVQSRFADRNDPDANGFITDADSRVVPSNRQWGESTEGAVGYEYGLVSFLWYRDRDGDDDDDPHNGSQPHWYDADTERDKSAKLKWQHFLENLDLRPGNPEVITGSMEYYNKSIRVIDPWEHDYVYECKPPYMKYTLWSGGPSGDSGDDINRDAFNE